MCLPFADIEAYLHYYAGRFRNQRFEHWELVSEAWLGIYPLTIPKFASQGICWAMGNYKRYQYAKDHKGKKDVVIQSLDDANAEGLYIRDILEAAVSNRQQKADDAEYARSLLKKLDMKDRLLIDERFFRGLTLQQIGKIHGCTKETIRLRVNKVIDKLRFRAKRVA